MNKAITHSVLAKRYRISPTGKKATLILGRGQNRAFRSATS